MKPPRVLAAALAVVLTAAACGPQETPTDAGATWVGTITTEGDVTTVVNESGSVWGGTARLVEEASIGVDAGADEYMFGDVVAVAASATRIFVVDRQVAAIRVFDAAGTYLYDIGGPGQGPGEFARPASIAIGADGRVFVRDDRARRILIFTEDGEYLDAYPMTGGINTATPMTLTAGDVPYSIVFVGLNQDDPNRVFELAMQAHGVDGPYGDLIMEPIDPAFVPGVVSSEDRSIQQSVPFFAQEEWALANNLDVIFGVSSSYRFELRRRDGSTVAVQNAVEPVAVDADEAAWHRARTTAVMRSLIPEWMWNGPEVPDVKPAFRGFIPTNSGETWVLRSGPGARIADCDEQAATEEEFESYPCWGDPTMIHVFGADGRFLGAIMPPPEMRFSPRPYVDGDLVVARAEDDNAMTMVKRYRLVVPGG